MPISPLLKKKSAWPSKVRLPDSASGNVGTVVAGPQLPEAPAAGDAPAAGTAAAGTLGAESGSRLGPSSAPARGGGAVGAGASGGTANASSSTPAPLPPAVALKGQPVSLSTAADVKVGDWLAASGNHTKG